VNQNFQNDHVNAKIGQQKKIESFVEALEKRQALLQLLNRQHPLGHLQRHARDRSKHSKKNFGPEYGSSSQTQLILSLPLRKIFPTDLKTIGKIVFKGFTARRSNLRHFQ